MKRHKISNDLDSDNFTKTISSVVHYLYVKTCTASIPTEKKTIFVNRSF